MSTIRAPHVPIIPAGDTLRVAVKLDREIYLEAKRLKIDIHTFFRLCLRQAVHALESKSGAIGGEFIGSMRGMDYSDSMVKAD